MISKNQNRYLRIYYLVTLSVNVIPYIILYFLLKNIAEAGPHPDPESDFILIAMFEFIFMVTWIIWLVHFIRFASKKSFSWIIISLFNIPYLYLLGAGQLSPVRIALTPLYLFYTRNSENSIPFYDQILAAVTLICWAIFIFLLKKRRHPDNI